MKYEKLIKKHLGINTPSWIIEKIENIINDVNKIIPIKSRNIGIICFNKTEYDILKHIYKLDKLDLLIVNNTTYYPIYDENHLCSVTLDCIIETKNAYKNPNYAKLQKIAQSNLRLT